MVWGGFVAGGVFGDSEGMDGHWGGRGGGVGSGIVLGFVCRASSTRGAERSSGIEAMSVFGGFRDLFRQMSCVGYGDEW